MKSYDAVIVGTGFASTFFLKKYLDKVSASVKVLVLERSHLFPHAERVKIKRGEASTYANLNPDPQDTFINKTPDKVWNFQPGFGGSSNCWVGCTPRFLPADFKMNTLYGVGNDWPISYEVLDPYYEEVEALMSVSGPDVTPFPRKKPYPQPPHHFTTVDSILHKKYGELYINQPTARARLAVNGRAPCCGSVVCTVCPVNAKFTVENSNFGVYEDPRVELMYGAHVHSLEVNGDTVTRVNYSKEGREFSVKGEIISLGTNPIFNSNILLNSGDANPLTGRGVGEQVGVMAIVYLDNLDCVGGSTKVNANGYMLYDGEHRKHYAACLMEGNNNLFIRPERGKWRQMAQFRMIFEDLPQNSNYVAKSPDRLKPEVYHKQHSAYTINAIKKMKEDLPKLLSCLPVEKIEYDDMLHSTESHIIGGTRMSTNIQEGVVDKYLIHHQFRNLFVLGSGSFTTFSPSNPTLTLCALSLHAADKSF